jgi:hypothetical protein
LGVSRLLSGNDKSSIISESEPFGPGFSQLFIDSDNDSHPFGTGSPWPPVDNNEHSVLVEISEDSSDNDKIFDFPVQFLKIELK